MSCSSPFATQILTENSLCDSILGLLSPFTLMRLARTCRAAHSAVSSHIARSFDINAHLSHYFSDPLDFRSLQATTGTLIAGSNALQFLDRSFYPEADLDLYCFPAEVIRVGEWILGQGYHFEPQSDQEEDFQDAAIPSSKSRGPYDKVDSLSGFYQFTKRRPRNGEEDQGTERDTQLKVQIIAAEVSPMYTILQSHSTVVLNVISFSHAYSLYPRATFHHRVALELLHYWRSSQEGKEAHAKYSQRGWHFISDMSVTQTQNYPERGGCLAITFPVGLRWIGDTHSWVLPLPIENVVQRSEKTEHELDSPSLIRDPSFVTSWEMIESRSQARRIQAHVLRDDNLKYSYVISDLVLSDSMYTLLPLDTRTPGFKPISPNYYDNKMIEYCKEMLEDQKLWSTWHPSKDFTDTATTLKRLAPSRVR